MHYSEGQLGRVYFLTIDDGEDFLAVTHEFIRNKAVQTGSYLNDLHADGIKIDRAFTRTVGTEAVTATVVPQILEMAQKLGLGIVVEGIETVEQADYFSGAIPGAHGQGWLFGRPVAAHEFKAQLRMKSGSAAAGPTHSGPAGFSREPEG